MLGRIPGPCRFLARGECRELPVAGTAPRVDWVLIRLQLTDLKLACDLLLDRRGERVFDQWVWRHLHRHEVLARGPIGDSRACLRAIVILFADSWHRCLIALNWGVFLTSWCLGRRFADRSLDNKVA